jgi:hypothetical protein
MFFDPVMKSILQVLICFLIAIPVSMAEESLQCSGDYSDSLSSMNLQNRRFEESPDARYTYCIRNTATYEHLYYGKGGKVRKSLIKKVIHGTGFAYKEKNGEWFVATNQHVAEQPDVTDSDSDLEGVPMGSRKIREVLEIVANEDDTFTKGHIPLKRVVADETLDTAVLKSRIPLKLMPYKIGDSSELKVGNILFVKGYPLGVFPASNTGRVTSLKQLDAEGAWSHSDFATDALLNSGNSGSPVFAISCKTGELELVGIYHAGYTDSQGMNLVVEIDQLKEMLETLRVTPHKAKTDDTAFSRQSVFDALMKQPQPAFIPFDDQVVRIDIKDGAPRFSLLSSHFPLDSTIRFAIVDAPGNAKSPAALILPERFGDNEIPWNQLDQAIKEPLQQFYDAVWRQCSIVLKYRQALMRAADIPEAKSEVTAIDTQIRKSRGEQKNIVDAIDFESERIVWPAMNGSGKPPKPQSDSEQN